MSCSLSSLNASGINRSNEYLSPATAEASQAIQQLLTQSFAVPLVNFDLESVHQIVADRHSQTWLGQVGTPQDFCAFAQLYVRASGKWQDGELPALEQLAMKHLIEAFAQGNVSFEQMMGRKNIAINDRRFLSVADRISGRYTILYNADARSIAAGQWTQKWVESIDKDDKGFLDNMVKFLIPSDQGTLVELGHEFSDEQRRMVLTMMFYTLFIADYSASSYAGPMPTSDPELEDRLKIGAIRDILARKQPDVLFMQEPIEDLETVLSTDKYQLFNQFSDDTAIFVSTTRAMAVHQLTEIACHTFIGENNPLINGCTAVIVRPEVDKPYLLLSVHVRSQPKRDLAMEALMKLFNDICSAHNVPQAFIGADANTDLLDGIAGVPTSVKQRTFLQYQLGKAHKEVRIRKDFIMSYTHAEGGSLNIKQVGEVCTEARVSDGLQVVDSDVSTQMILPTELHPFDHYMVSSTVDMLLT